MPVKAVGMSNKRVPNSKVLKTLWALGLIMVVVGIGAGSFYFLRGVVFAVETCPSPHSNSVAAIFCNDLYWEWCLVLVIAGLMITLIARSQYLRYYVVVHTGIVVDKREDEYGYSHPWEVKVEGITLAGEKRTSWHMVSGHSYHQLESGDSFPVMNK